MGAKTKALESKFHKEIRAGKDYKATESELETHLNKSSCLRRRSSNNF